MLCNLWGLASSSSEKVLQVLPYCSMSVLPALFMTIIFCLDTPVPFVLFNSALLSLMHLAERSRKHSRWEQVRSSACERTERGSPVCKWRHLLGWSGKGPCPPLSQGAWKCLSWDSEAQQLDWWTQGCLVASWSVPLPPEAVPGLILQGPGRSTPWFCRVSNTVQWIHSLLKLGSK
jgi:hypothetical protein